MFCYAIRKKPWLQLMKMYPQFDQIIKQKTLKFYLNQIYHPMVAFKQLDLQFFKRRQDFQEQIAVHNFDKNEMKICIYQCYEDYEGSKEKMKKDRIEDGKTSWLLSRIQHKLPMCFDLGV